MCNKFVLGDKDISGQGGLTGIPDIVLAQMNPQFMGKYLYPGTQVTVADYRHLMGIGQGTLMNGMMQRCVLLSKGRTRQY